MNASITEALARMAEPLFLVERDGETPHSVEDNGAFLADLETQPC